MKIVNEFLCEDVEWLLSFKNFNLINWDPIKGSIRLINICQCVPQIVPYLYMNYMLYMMNLHEFDIKSREIMSNMPNMRKMLACPAGP